MGVGGIGVSVGTGVGGINVTVDNCGTSVAVDTGMGDDGIAVGMGMLLGRLHAVRNIATNARLISRKINHCLVIALLRFL
jgi:hypothetical protein